MFPIGFYRDENGELNVQGIKINTLAAKYGTPLFIYDTGLMKERYEVFLNTVKNKTIRLKGNNSWMIRVAASSEMSNNQGNSQYYLYAYRAGNTPSNVMNAFSMANNSGSNTYSWYQADIDASTDEEWEFACEYYPELTSVYTSLRKIIHELANCFKLWLLIRKDFDQIEEKLTFDIICKSLFLFSLYIMSI